MWKFLRPILARSKVLDSALGEVIFETPPLGGQWSGSLLQWRTKKGLDERTFFVSLKLVPDVSYEVNGRETNFINLDINSARQARADLDLCIEDYYRFDPAKRQAKVQS